MRVALLVLYCLFFDGNAFVVVVGIIGNVPRCFLLIQRENVTSIH